MFYLDEKQATEEELKYKKLSYKHLLEILDIYNNMVLCNNITEFHDLRLVNGVDFDEENEEYTEIYQYFICSISDWALKKAKETDLIIYYCNDLDVYVLGVDHFGTSWDYVLTDVEFTTDLEKALNS